MQLRNTLYDSGKLRSVRFALPVISIGNLAVGGTGKTPVTLYLAEWLAAQHHIGILSRGYGRKSKGYLFADSSATAATLGDEPMLYHRHFSQNMKVAVAVAEERILGIPSLLNDAPETEIILLDDAYQHRSVKPGLQLLLTEWQRPFSSDFVLPAGRLREPRKGAKRADAVIVTRCPAETTAAEKQQLFRQLKKYLKAETPVFFSQIQYKPLQNAFSGEAVDFPQQFALVSGIARPHPLVQHVKRKGKLLQHFNFNDHCSYNTGQLKELQEWHKQSPVACPY